MKEKFIKNKYNILKINSTNNTDILLYFHPRYIKCHVYLVYSR